VVNGVFEADGVGGVRFHEARGIGPETIAAIQTQVRHRLLSVLARRGVLTPIELIERLAALDSHTTPAGC
jgi:hypothetical protein